MKNHKPTDMKRFEHFILEIDGKVNSEFECFQEALKAGLELRRKFPQSQVKLHDANKQTTGNE